MEKRSKHASLLVQSLVVCLISQNLVIPVISITTTSIEDNKNYYSPDPHSGSSPSGLSDSLCSHKSPPSHHHHHGTPSHGGSYNPSPSTPSGGNCGGSPPYDPTPTTPTTPSTPTTPTTPSTPSTPTTPSTPSTPTTPSNPPSEGGGYYNSPPPSYDGNSPPTPSYDGNPPPTPSYDGNTPPTPSDCPPTPSYDGNTPPTPSYDGNTPPTPSYDGNTPPTPSYDGNTPPTPSSAYGPPTPSGAYGPPTPYGAYGPPTPITVSPPTTPIDPGTPTIPSPPYLPSPSPIIGGTCNYWRNHPGFIWGLLGWWGTLGNAFGVGSVPGFGASMSLPESLGNTRNDGYGALYREATASFLNSLVNNKFPYTTKQVRDRFASSLTSNKAAAAQAHLFRMANEGRMKPRV